MKKILAFGASNSKNSINKQLATYAANQLKTVEITIADLNHYESPLYSVDEEKACGVHENAIRFHDLIQESDAVIISVAEYNGLHTSAFKNLWDWMSRIPMEKPMNIWNGNPMFLLSASPSRRPMNNVLKISKELFPHFGTKIIADFYLPSFNHFFKEGQIIDATYQSQFQEQLNLFQRHIDAM
ncbi:MAG: NAD(P)H-dependent oxidoreductase [Bacteroidota bacterium]